MLNRTGPNTEPCGTPLVTRHQLDLIPLPTALWACSTCKYFTWTVSLLNNYYHFPGLIPSPHSSQSSWSFTENLGESFSIDLTTPLSVISWNCQWIYYPESDNQKEEQLFGVKQTISEVITTVTNSLRSRDIYIVPFHCIIHVISFDRLIL